MVIHNQAGCQINNTSRATPAFIKLLVVRWGMCRAVFGDSISDAQI
jgi:hypothetical protein